MQLLRNTILRDAYHSMNHLIRFLARLYPARWRQRYGVEFAALLEDSNPDWRTSVDVLKGAMETQMQTWNPIEILALAGAAGAVFALAGSFAMPKQFVSQAVIKVDPQRTPDGKVPDSRAVIDQINTMAQRVLSRTSLTSTINTYDLYKSERKEMPLEGVIEGMRRKIQVFPLRRSGQETVPAITIQFTSDDPATAQKVAQSLVGAFIDQNVRGLHPDVRVPPSGGGMTLQLLDPASLPRNPSSPARPLITTIGLGVGLVVGGLLAWLGRSRKPA